MFKIESKGTFRKIWSGSKSPFSTWSDFSNPVMNKAVTWLAFLTSLTGSKYLSLCISGAESLNPKQFISNNTLEFFENEAMVILSRIILLRRDNTIMSCSNVMSNLHLANRSQMKSSQSGKPVMSSSQDEHFQNIT